MYVSDLVSHLQTLIACSALDFVFQPIFDLRRREITGYEALMRGPDDSPLNTPAQLLQVAREAGLELALERLASRLALEAFAAVELPGSLFLNLSLAALIDQARTDGVVALAGRAGLPPTRLVVEPLPDAAATGCAATACASLDAQGVRIAVHGALPPRERLGFRPAFLKLGPAAFHRIHADPLRRLDLASVLAEAARRGVQVVAEGVEDARELATLFDLGCDCAQGHLLGRPAADPLRRPSRGVDGLLQARAILQPRPADATLPV